MFLLCLLLVFPSSSSSCFVPPLCPFHLHLVVVVVVCCCLLWAFLLHLCIFVVWLAPFPTPPPTSSNSDHPKRKQAKVSLVGYHSRWLSCNRDNQKIHAHHELTQPASVRSALRPQTKTSMGQDQSVPVGENAVTAEEFVEAMTGQKLEGPGANAGIDLVSNVPVTTRNSDAKRCEIALFPFTNPACAHRHTHTQTQPHGHKPTATRPHRHRHRHSHTDTATQTQPHTHKHTHTNTHKHTQTHAHTMAIPRPWIDTDARRYPVYQGAGSEA